MKRILPVALSLSLVLALFSGCDQTETNTDPSDNSTSSSVTADFAKTDADMFTNRDLENSYDAEHCIPIQLNGDSASCDSDHVAISGSSITITAQGTYLLSGTLNDGMIIVDAPDTAKLQLVLNDANITSSTCAALYIREADKVFLTAAEGTTNALANGGTFNAIDENNIDGAIYSKQDLTLNGTGSLAVTSPVGHGIVCKDDLVLSGGVYTITSASHGLDANDSVRIANTDLTIDAGKDGIHAENNEDSTLGFVYVSSGSLNIEAEGDGISAGAHAQITGGTFDLLIGGGSENGEKQSSDIWGDFMGGGMPRPGGRTVTETTESTDASTSMKGIKAEGGILISGGVFSIDSADDSIHSGSSATISNGTLQLASGDDAIHAEETLEISGGTIHITESYEGLEALHIKVLGGNIDLVASDDGLNAAGGMDSSGTTGGRDQMFGGGMGGRFGGMGGMSGSSNGSILISGGELYINASGDGIDANGSLTISGGYTVVCGPTQGDTATLDYDSSATITGGTFIGTGASGMAQTFSDSEQGVFAVSVGNQTAGTAITLADADGNVVISHTPALSYSVVILSSPDLIKGESYTITINSQSATFEAT